LLFVHGLYSKNSDSLEQDPDGMKAFKILSGANQCGDGATPVETTGCQEGGMAVDPGCADIGACAAPLRFCHHNGPSLQGDAWPCAANAAISQFFEPYRE
jgi:hypothetical protein